MTTHIIAILTNGSPYKVVASVVFGIAV